MAVIYGLSYLDFLQAGRQVGRQPNYQAGQVGFSKVSQSARRRCCELQNLPVPSASRLINKTCELTTSRRKFSCDFETQSC